MHRIDEVLIKGWLTFHIQYGASPGQCHKLLGKIDSFQILMFL